MTIENAHLSDPHNGGQSAALFACGEQKYIYKPRSAEADVAWAEFLAALAALTGAELPRAVRPVSPEGAGYTIVPFVEGREAASEDEARAYYRRCGALLAACMVLGTVDMHSENLIADGDSPVLVDVETIMAGVTPDKAQRAGQMYDSLIFSHLLPNWMLMDGENVDVGALSGAGRNQLRLNGQPCHAWAYADEICQGFRKAYDGLIRNKQQVERELERFAKAPFRKLLRPTDLYGRLCDQIARLETAEEKRASAERLRRAYLRGGEKWAQKMARACESEIEAVLRGDIPYFFSYGDERCLRDIDGVVTEDYYALSPLEAAKMRLNALRLEDGAAQEKIIRQSLQTTCPTVEKRRVQSAVEVFEWLQENAIEGCPSVWMGLTTGARGEAYFQSIGFDLYEGLLGVLVFCAALYESTGDDRALKAIREGYQEYRKWYIQPESSLRPDTASICLTSGLGGHVLALGYLARALGDESYLHDAARLLARFDFDGYSDAENWDVYGGAGGLLTALPLLKGFCPDEQLAGIAAQLAERIRHTRPALTGYAHGAAGLALALGAAQYASGKDYSADILRLLEWENAQFDEEAKNWPDLRDPEKHGFMKGLCSGAPGIGLARLQLGRYVKDEQIAAICKRDIGRVQAFLQAQKQPLKRDTLCCGNAALVEAERALMGSVSNARLNQEP
ncbi:MAG: DUF4135 domain-containing protein, partial [Clostridia bacterium]|nr:DUF4135 domain-containing protein [Clostridia bacterium]